MKSSLNVLRSGLAATICISLLAACDGRGSTAFKSYRDTPEEYAARTKARDEARRRAAEGNHPIPSVEGGTLSPDTSSSGLRPPQPTELPSLTGQPGTAPAGVDSTVNSGTAPQPVAPGTDQSGLDPRSKIFPEVMDLEEAQRKFTKVADLTEKVNKYLVLNTDETKNMSAAAATILKEIKFSGVSTSRPLQLSYKAALTMDSLDRFLFVDGAAVDGGREGDVIPLDAQLNAARDGKGQVLKKGEAIIPYAYCPDRSDCKYVHVLFQIASKTGTVYAVFLLEPKADGFKIVSHNIGPDLKEFAEKKEETADDKNKDQDQNQQKRNQDQNQNQNQNNNGQQQDQNSPKKDQPQKTGDADVRPGESFDEYRQRRNQEAAQNPLNLPKPENIAALDLAKKGVAPAKTDLFALSSQATQQAAQQPFKLEAVSGQANTKSVMFQNQPAKTQMAAAQPAASTPAASQPSAATATPSSAAKPAASQGTTPAQAPKPTETPKAQPAPVNQGLKLPANPAVINAAKSGVQTKNDLLAVSSQAQQQALNLNPASQANTKSVMFQNKPAQTQTASARPAVSANKGVQTKNDLLAISSQSQPPLKLDTASKSNSQSVMFQNKPVQTAWKQDEASKKRADDLMKQLTDGDGLQSAGK